MRMQLGPNFSPAWGCRPDLASLCANVYCTLQACIHEVFKMLYHAYIGHIHESAITR